MKKFFVVFAMSLLAFVGCNRESGSQAPEALNGQWHLVSWNGGEPEFDVYMKLNNGNFDLYQQVWSLDYKHYYGVYTVNGGVIHGQYVDGADWSCGYRFSVEGKTLTLYSQQDQSIVSVYKSCKIPQQVINEAMGTRAMDVVPFL